MVKFKQLCKVAFLILIGIAIGVSGTLLLQYFRSAAEPSHRIEARSISPNQSWEIVVEEFDPGDNGVPWRTFKICNAGDRSETPESIDGSIYYLRELLSGGCEITNMKVYWIGTKAVVESGGFHLLEWDLAHDTEWHAVNDHPTTMPATKPSPH